MCHVTSHDPGFNGLCDFMGGGSSVTVSLHLVMFGGHWSSASRYMTYLICHVTSQDHMIEGSYDFVNRSSLLCVTTQSTTMVIDIVVVDICF